MRAFVKCGVWLAGMVVACAAYASPGEGVCDAIARFTPGIEGASLARVGGRGPLHFLADDAGSNGCPGKGGAVCQRKAYVVPGDVVVIGKRLEGLRCASYYGNKYDS